MDLIEIFNSIRDIPYHCPESAEDLNHSCWGKHRILYHRLMKAGHKVRYRVCEFKWSELKFPKELVDKAPTDSDLHLYLEIELGEKWIKLDCSNDKSLGKYNKWDGKSDTELQVKCKKILSPEESAIAEEDNKKNHNKIVEEQQEFYCAINKFLSKIRRN
jgi:hypothetical protein